MRFEYLGLYAFWALAREVAADCRPVALGATPSFGRSRSHHVRLWPRKELEERTRRPVAGQIARLRGGSDGTSAKLPALLLVVTAAMVEIVGSTLIKKTEGFTRLAFVPPAAACIGLSWYCFGMALKTMEISVAYCIWCAVGTSVSAVIGATVFHEEMNPLKVLSFALILSGILILEGTS